MRTLLALILLIGLGNLAFWIVPPKADVTQLLALNEACMERLKEIEKQSGMWGDPGLHSLEYMVLLDQCTIYSRAASLLDPQTTKKWIAAQDEKFLNALKEPARDRMR